MYIKTRDCSMDNFNLHAQKHMHTNMHTKQKCKFDFVFIGNHGPWVALTIFISKVPGLNFSI